MDDIGQVIDPVPPQIQHIMQNDEQKTCHRGAEIDSADVPFIKGAPWQKLDTEHHKRTGNPER